VEQGRVKHTTIRTLYLPVLIVAGVLMACAAALLALSEKAEATFPGKNGRIAYVAGAIKTINPGGGGKTKVTMTWGGEQPSYSPNGKRIAYASWDAHDQEIYTIRVGGGGKTQVTHNDAFDFDPCYSPNGKKIAFDSDDGHDTEIYTINVGGGGKFKVTDNRRNDFYPDYSPDGKRIAYTHYDGHDTDLYTIKAGGGGRFPVTKNDKDELAPSYSPDGKKIAYTGYKGLGSDDGDDFDSEIYTIKVGGGGKTQVTYTKYYASDPSWGSRP
jgi:Tol biopolymer transport system component